MKIVKLYQVKVLTEWAQTTRHITPVIYKYITKGTYMKVREEMVDIQQHLTLYCDSYDQALQCTDEINKACPFIDWVIIQSIKPKYALRFGKINDFN